jgi:hypothetical protein
MSGKPTVATVPPSFTVRLAAIFTLSKVKSTSRHGNVCVDDRIAFSSVILVKAVKAAAIVPPSGETFSPLPVDEIK